MKEIPPHLQKEVFAYARITFKPAGVLVKFFGLMLAGALATLTVCPQYGWGPLGGGHGISHWIMPYGAWACGAFCGMIFIGAGTLLAQLLLSTAEWRWVWRRQLWLTTLPVLIAFMGLMVLGKPSSLTEGMDFHVAWNLTGIMTCWIVLHVMKRMKPRMAS